MIDHMYSGAQQKPQVQPARYLVGNAVSNAYQQWGKRFFDIVVAIAVTAGVLVWAIPLIGLIIRLESAGPVLFVQKRSGRNGRQFACIKFRTMKYVRNATFEQAIYGDLRVTRVGKFLRKSNLDELPQFLNVLAGHMSVIGPRPHPLPLDEKYWYTLPGYRERYTVRPGITGLAQSRGSRGETTKRYQMGQRVRYDHLYIRRQSPWLDAKICWWTVKSAVNGNKNAW